MPLIFKYIKKRFNFCLYIPLCFLLAVSGQSSISDALVQKDFYSDIAAALLLVLWLRLWDDLCSRETDRISFPDRITVNNDNAKILWRWFAVLSLMSFAVVYQVCHITNLITVFVLAVLFWVLYSLKTRLNRLMFDLLVLTKYPAIALIISPSNMLFRNKVFPLCMIFLILVIYEAFHDATRRTDKSYLYTGFIAWMFLFIGFTASVMTVNIDYRFKPLGYGVLGICLGLFLAAVKYEKVRKSKIIPLSNGLLYFGLLLISK